jgi:hypothetical protein
MPVSITRFLVGRGERPALCEPLHVLLEIPPCHEDSPAAGAATKADVSAEANDAPGVPTAGMLLPQDDDIVEVKRYRALRTRLRHGGEV